MLVDTAVISLGGRKLGDAKKLIEEMGVTIELAEPRRHRAEADARRLALAVAEAIMPVRPQPTRKTQSELPADRLKKPCRHDQFQTLIAKPLPWRFLPRKLY
jgi:hypothetical protein